ncbi:hypothetical protein, partial [Klebsiella pneumoniae]|uniref:hypothetical protein n=1 Tax=Klebsiella pneumoniae TaxID=573 RepID=UPI00287BB8E6
ASLYVAPPLYDASDFASFSRAEKAILPVMTLIYTIQRRRWRENVHLNKKRKKVIVRGSGSRVRVSFPAPKFESTILIKGFHLADAGRKPKIKRE